MLDYLIIIRREAHFHSTEKLGAILVFFASGMSQKALQELCIFISIHKIPNYLLTAISLPNFYPYSFSLLDLIFFMLYIQIFLQFVCFVQLLSQTHQFHKQTGILFCRISCIKELYILGHVEILHYQIKSIFTIGKKKSINSV